MTGESFSGCSSGVGSLEFLQPTRCHMSDAVIVADVRSAIGKKKGALSATRADDLLAHVLGSLAERAKIDPAQVEDVITGCVTQIGEQGFNVSRTAALMAG